jgi:hypothetical protein
VEKSNDMYQILIKEDSSFQQIKNENFTLEEMFEKLDEALKNKPSTSTEDTNSNASELKEGSSSSEKKNS